MKQLFIFTATILACMGMRAQETGIDSVLSPDRSQQQGVASQCTTYLITEAGEQDRKQPAGSHPLICPSLGL